jgi:hypothetical protein
MAGDAEREGDDRLTWWLSQRGISPARFRACRPDFLVISPPKTGSTWLADNLRCHPQVYVPALKEIKYFSTFFEALDLGWYLEHFTAGGGRLKGEASPTYALLPVDRIRLIRRLMPDLKLIFLMRDPVARAWSHAKHTYRYRELNFASCALEFAAVEEARWHANFVEDWALASGDYLGQLQRWLSVFPREQMYVGFFGSIVKRPEALLREIFEFLGVAADLDLAAFPVRERILAGISGEPSASLKRTLHQLLHARTVALAEFLRAQFGLVPPPEWSDTLAPPAQPDATFPSNGPIEVFARALDDGYLTRVLDAEKSFPSARCLIQDDHHGYALFFRRGRFYALSRSLPPLWPGDVDDAVLEDYQRSGDCFSAATLAGVKACVDRHVAGEAPRGRPWYSSGALALYRAWDRLRALFTVRKSTPPSPVGTSVSTKKQAA